MRVLVLYAHPVETSFVSALHKQVVDTLRSRGNEVDDCDLYVEGFDPLLSRQDRIDYNNPGLNRTRVEPYVDRLFKAEALVLIYPVWNEGFPAILKGFLDRVFLPGVSLEVNADGSLTPNLKKVTKLAAVCTYGLDHLRTILAGDPPRRVVKRTLRSLVGPHASCDYLAHYDMNHTTRERRGSFLSKVKRTFEAW
jgi:NAD(P)H dehydrogenase (quinone)